MWAGKSALRVLSTQKLYFQRVSTASALHAGHNKWSKVRHVKIPADRAKGVLFSRHALAIIASVKKQGSADPLLNTHLKTALENAKKDGMPKASLDKAIQKGLRNERSEYCFHLWGLGDFQFIVRVYALDYSEVLLASRALKKACDKHSLERPSSVNDIGNGFIWKGILNTPKSHLSEDVAMEMALEAEAEEVHEIVDENGDEFWQFICDGKDLAIVQSKLEKKDVTFSTSTTVYNPVYPIQLTENYSQKVQAFLDRLNQIENVTDVFTNYIES